MKHIRLLIGILFLTSSLLAQEGEQRNYFFVGGNLNFLIQNNATPNSSVYSNYSNFDSKNTTFSINPYIGKELNDNFFIGFLVNFRTEIRKYTKIIPGNYYATDRTVRMAGISGFTRYCFNPEKKFKFFLQGTVGYNSIQKKQSRTSFNGINNQKSVYFEASVTPIILFQISPRIHITGQFGKLFYQIGETDFNTGSTNAKPARERIHFNTFGLNVNASNIFVGIEYQF